MKIIASHIGAALALAGAAVSVAAGGAHARYTGTQAACVTGLPAGSRLPIYRAPNRRSQIAGTFSATECGMGIESVDGAWTYVRGSDRGRNVQGWIENRFLRAKNVARPAPVPRGSGPVTSPLGFPVRASSGGGIVREGPGTNFRKITSLRELEPITVTGTSGIMFQGYPWFTITYRGGRRGYQWGGIICSEARAFRGAFDTCANFRRSLARNRQPAPPPVGNPAPGGSGPVTSPLGFPVRASSGGGIVREGPGTNFRKITSLRELEPITVTGTSGIMFQGYPWFTITYRGGRRGYKWGGIICSEARAFKGVFDTCANFRRSLARNRSNAQPQSQPSVGAPPPARGNSRRTVNYTCDEGIPLIVTFIEKGNESYAIYSHDSGPKNRVAAQRSGSGFAYSNGYHALRGKGRNISLIEGGKLLHRCKG